MSKEKYRLLDAFCLPKLGEGSSCGDALVVSENYIAVIDGATPKGSRLWDGRKGDAFVASVLKSVLEKLPSELSAEDAIRRLNRGVRAEYESRGLLAEALAPEERLQASIVIYSVARREIWSFGDCQYRIGGESFSFARKGDTLFADLRAFVLAAASEEEKSGAVDIGREAILPFLKKFLRFANAGGEFGYDVINGCEICAERVKITKANVGDRIVLASDGYPCLFDTLAESEAYLQKALAEDPLCIGVLRSTKGLSPDQISFDDRSFVSFVVE